MTMKRECPHGGRAEGWEGSCEECMTSTPWRALRSWLSSWATTLHIMIFERDLYRRLREPVQDEDFVEVARPEPPYQMNPETDVLMYADELVPGMEVLHEEPSLRERGRDGQFATVDRMRPGTGTPVSFIATYPDGVQRRWSVGISEGFIVRKGSIPK